MRYDADHVSYLSSTDYFGRLSPEIPRTAVHSYDFGWILMEHARANTAPFSHVCVDARTPQRACVATVIERPVREHGGVDLPSSDWLRGTFSLGWGTYP